MGDTITLKCVAQAGRYLSRRYDVYIGKNKRPTKKFGGEMCYYGLRRAIKWGSKIPKRVGESVTYKLVPTTWDNACGILFVKDSPSYPCSGRFLVHLTPHFIKRLGVDTHRIYKLREVKK